MRIRGSNISAYTLALGVFLGTAGYAVAQDDPFDIPMEGEADSPFAAPQQQQPPSPFGQPQPQQQPPAEFDPFDIPADPGQASPFDAPGQPDPFAAPDAPSPFDAPGAPADPFAMPPAQQPMDPFAPQPGMAPPAEQPVSPFGFTEDEIDEAPAVVSPFAGIFGEQAPRGPAAEGQRGGISTLYDFRYIEVPRIDGTRLVVRQRMTLEEARQWDAMKRERFAERATGGEYPHFNAATQSPEDWAEWMLYAEQLDLWDRYVQQVALGRPLPQIREEADVRWPGDPSPDQQQQAQQAGRPDRPQNIYNEDRSLDDQVMDFVPLPDTRAGRQGQSVIDPDQMNQQAVALYQRRLSELRSIEQEQHAFLLGLQNQLERRVTMREAYDEWREAQIALVMDYVEEWERQFRGRVTTIAGVRYELYRPEDVPSATTRGANVVVTDHDLTPYDILNEDGTLRGPSR